MQPMVLSRAIG